MPDLKSGSLSRRLLPLLGLLPALVAPWLIYSWMKDCLLNVPFMDDYVWLHIYEKLHAGTFNWWNDLFFVQMEHRLTVPATLATVCYLIKPGQITLHNWFSFGELCLIGWIILFLLKRTFPELRHRWFVGAVAMWVLFSPVQTSTLLWSDCMSSYMPIAFFAGAVAVFQSNLRDWLKLALCLLFAVLGSVSFASGLLIWPLMALMIAASGKVSGARRWIILGIWLVAFAVTMKLYFMNLTNQAEPAFSYEQGHEKTLGKADQFSAFIGNPWRSMSFVFMFAGAILGRGTLAGMQDATFYTGLALTVLLAAFVVLAFHALLKKKDAAIFTATLPWLLLGFYTFGCGAMVALGRLYSRKSLVSALWNRYTIHAAPLVIAVVVLAFVWWQRFVTADTASGVRARLRSVGPVLAGAFVMLVLNGWIYGQNNMEAWWSSRLRDATCQIFGGVPAPFDARQPMTRNLELAKRMDDIGLLHPPMVKSTRLDQFPVLGTSSGRIEDFDLNTSGVFMVRGTAYIHGQARPADGVLLSWKDARGVQTMFSLGQVTSPPLFLRGVLEADLQYLYQPTPSIQHNFGSFEIPFDKSLLPKGDVEVSAWAFDFLRQGVYAIPGRFLVNGETGKADLIEEEKTEKKEKP